MSNYPELPWIAEARKHIGLKEDTSKFKHSPTILKWLKVLGADKKAWVLAFVKSFVNDIGDNWERWAKVIITFIDFAKSVFNSKRG